MNMRLLTLPLAAVLLASCVAGDAAVPAADMPTGGEAATTAETEYEAAPNARTACDGLRRGDACTFDGRRGEVEGTCMAGRRGEGLVCRRGERRARHGRRHPVRSRRGRPDVEGREERAEAMRATARTACEELNEGDACSFEGPRGPVQGTCRARDAGALACHRTGRRRPHEPAETEGGVAP